MSILKLKKRSVHLLEYALFRVAAWFLTLVPEWFARASGRALGSFVWRVVPLRRKHVLESLSRAFPQKSPSELERIGLFCYRNLGHCFVEFVRLNKLTGPWMERNITIEGREILDRLLGQGLGVIFVCFHYGDWELEGAYLGHLGYPLDVIARSQTNPFFDRYVSRMREACGMRLLPVTRSTRHVARSLRDGRIVAFLADQDAHQAGVFVDFLGRPASTPRGPAMYAYKTGAPVVLSFMTPAEGGKWNLVFEHAPRPETEDREEFIGEMTSFFTSRLDYYVRQAPEHWFWPHRRWKTKQPEANLKQPPSALPR
ncbi:MAG TPA: lysophospholipid acyltransferase family protein [archaeon]|nr:lysophospholipid acyltransferase family protein [archaeon]